MLRGERDGLTVVNDPYHNGLENFWSDRGKDTGVIIHPDLLVDGVHLVWIWSATTSTIVMSVNAHKRTNAQTRSSTPIARSQI